MAPPPEPPDGSTLVYMSPFYNSAIRARRAEVRGSGKRIRGVRGVRPHSPSHGQRPLGYRIQGKHQSQPAYTMAAKYVISPNVDPLALDTNIPGPGRYDMLKY